MTAMLGPNSSNEAANALIEYVGGIAAINKYCQDNGYTNSSIDAIYGNETSTKTSTALDVHNAFYTIFSSGGTNYVNVQAMFATSGLGLANETRTLIGNNSQFEGAASLIVKEGKKYLLVVLAKNLEERNKRAAEVYKQIPA